MKLQRTRGSGGRGLSDPPFKPTILEDRNRGAQLFDYWGAGRGGSFRAAVDVLRILFVVGSRGGVSTDSKKPTTNYCKHVEGVLFCKYAACLSHRRSGRSGSVGQARHCQLAYWMC